MLHFESALSVTAVTEVAKISLPTAYGHFDATAFEAASGCFYLALVKGSVGGPDPVLVRLHSECLTGDTLSSLRCDCGEQLRLSFRAISAEGRGVVVYILGQEGRGIGLLNKLRAYAEQERGADTVEANVRLGLPVDARRYDEVAHLLAHMGIGSVRLLTNNPSKVSALQEAGAVVVAVESLLTSPHLRNAAYLRTKGEAMGHRGLDGSPSRNGHLSPPDLPLLLGSRPPPADRPKVIVKYAQTLDGRIATRSGDSKWISGESERRLSHALRGACDAVMVGMGTVVADDPRLTVRMVSGVSPMRVVLDSCLRIPDGANVLADEAPTLIFTTSAAPAERRRELMRRGVGVRVVDRAPEGVSLRQVLDELCRSGVESLLVEGGGRVITSLLRAGLVDRMVVALAPTILGEGTAAVGDLGTESVLQGIALEDRYSAAVGDDLVVAGDIARP